MTTTLRRALLAEAAGLSFMGTAAIAAPAHTDPPVAADGTVEVTFPEDATGDVILKSFSSGHWY